MPTVVPRGMQNPGHASEHIKMRRADRDMRGESYVFFRHYYEEHVMSHILHDDAI